MHIRLNGMIREVPDGITISRLLETLALGTHQVVVQLNTDIVRREQYPDRVLLSDDAIEILTFSPGG